jgi:dolichol-phosphate mannosyltransferase
VLISRSRPEFLSHFLLRHHLERFVDAFDHAQPWWFFLPVFFLLLLPGSLALPSLAAMVLSRNPRVRALRRREDGYLALAAVWIIAFFSLSSSKLASYVLPALPVTGLLLGRLLDLAVWRELSESSVLSKAVPRGAVVAGLLLGGGLGLLDIALDGEPLVEGHLWAGGMVVASLAVGLVGVFERLVDGRQRWLLAAGLFWAGWTFLFFDLLPEAAYLRSLPRRARAVATLDPGKGFLPILAVGHRLGPGMMYMRRDEIEDLAPENVEPIRRRLELSARLVLIADREIAGQVVSYAPERTLEELDAEGHLFLIARRPDTGGSGGG